MRADTRTGTRAGSRTDVRADAQADVRADVRTDVRAGTDGNPIGTVMVCNRGEIAVRIVRACRDLGIRAVVAHSTADRDSLAVRLADEAVCVGPGPSARSYLNIPAILYACARTGADAVHPGYGFLSENAVFARACAEAGVRFIGPPAELIALMGDKITARAAMRDAGVPVLPGSDGPVASARDAARIAAEIGYPVVVKAAAGGGGRGIAIVHDPDDLPEAYRSTVAAARTLFHDERVYLEKFVSAARHVEVQVLGDAHGSIVHLGERDCSVQRRQQKLVEESPSPFLDDAGRAALCEAAVAGAEAIGYVSAGTFEFLVDGAGRPYFIEMNTRLQVEHPVTEERTGVDVVQWMIRVAAGERLTVSQADIVPAGHSIEARINAEDPSAGWAGSAGAIDRLVLPGGPGVRVDTHAYGGYVVPPYYDSLLAKVIVSAPTRELALRRLGRALDEFSCSGVRTNVDFHRRLVRDERFRAGDYRLDIVESVL
ncbi:acetyl-CoA carboxylase biotin carboxylase subunit [Streptosporangium pseudovulgare]|uniref:biotin carboxylase n=1 Tax=Streptosporangium pseudovulgare TaxID=35765 RepID=A0ABQ2R359_9ACTN|nr:acetyl-CoA carboxylase biotin carboxylase subunit [Streptosporangium pseudovulgare]GGQ06502.1 acetyl-CoA carboxylase biotin carboxylase subunit [Streptosporangium pseudovulgare]